MQLDYCTVRAPFTGVIIAKAAQVGEIVSPFSAGGGFTRTGIGTIVDMDSLEIEVDVNESYINRVVANQKIEAVLDAYPDWKIPGHVIAIIPTADRSKATVKVRVAMDQKDARIVPDMGVRVSFLEEAPKHGAPAAPPPPKGVLVPANSIVQRDGKSAVFAIDGDKARLRARDAGTARWASCVWSKASRRARASCASRRRRWPTVRASRSRSSSSSRNHFPSPACGRGQGEGTWFDAPSRRTRAPSSGPSGRLLPQAGEVTRNREK